MRTYRRIVLFPMLLCIMACQDRTQSNHEMVSLLKDIYQKEYNMRNPFCPEAKLAYFDSMINVSQKDRNFTPYYYKAMTLLELGKEEESLDIFRQLLDRTEVNSAQSRITILKWLALGYMRRGERINCLRNHNDQSCVFPISGAGVHVDQASSSKAIEIYEAILRSAPDDLESRWLLNIAYMTIGGYPDKVPSTFLIPGLDKDSSDGSIKPFADMAVRTGLSTKNLAGGSIIEDFDNDNYLDIVTSSWDLKEGMHYCRNNGDGTFTEMSDTSQLSQFTGGLNIIQTDYNNDGLKDIFVLRGAWRGQYGKEPNSLLRNNGDGTFTDVTMQSGLLSFHPTQTATWNDFNNDGWLDLFIGNESRLPTDVNPCEFYINNGDGTFTESSAQSDLLISDFVKGVTSGDYDNDGWPDIFISTLSDQKILLKNQGLVKGVVKFKDVTIPAGLGNCHTKTFPTTFLDYDNDGWLDILICSYEFSGSLAQYAAAEALQKDVGIAAKQYLFRNKHDGTFEDVTDKVGLNKVAFSMGMNFGDIDNDGYPDLYMSTGNPLYQSLVPNKLFRNNQGKSFSDVTLAARVGNLQKGHGVSIADLDNDGDQDIYIDMGGAYAGDAYQNSLYINPGQNNNRWINLILEGTRCNRAAIGAKVKVYFRENGVERFVYREVNSGGSFGANPLQQHIGIGSAAVIDRIEVRWPVSNIVQEFRNVQAGQTIKIVESRNEFSKISVRQTDFSTNKSGLISCSPTTSIINGR